MRKIKIYELSKEILDNEHCEDHAFFEYLCEEAQPTKALEFFKLEFDRDTHSISVPDEFDFDKAIETVNQYLQDVDELGDWGESQPTDDSNEYNEYTKDSRGADDGTLDYAGTYVISILSVLQAHLNK